MHRRQIAALAALLALSLASAVRADDSDKEEIKEKLRELQDYIGVWKGSGQPDKPKPSPRDPIWNEVIDWSWRFKGDDVWLRMDVKNGKQFKRGIVRYLPDKMVYQLSMTDKDDNRLVFLGTIKKEILTWQREDPADKSTQQITMNIAGDGVRFIYRVAHREEGKTFWLKDFVVACTKEGESLGKVEKKNECVVSGGVGTIAISYKGETFWVCCSGCRDAFNENPEKYIAEFKAKKAGKK
jgi:hypothetical protein